MNSRRLSTSTSRPRLTIWDKPFLMPIEDVPAISGRGTVVTGRVERGKLPVNSNVEIVGIRPTQTTTVTSIETFHKQMDECEAGDNTGLLPAASTVTRSSVARFWLLLRDPAHQVRGRSLRADQGRRRPSLAVLLQLPSAVLLPVPPTSPALSPLPEGVEMVQPGDHATFGVELIQPIAMEEGLTFAVREGGHTVGSGRVTKIIE